MTLPQKNIVICSDGTGNTTTKGRGTNVFKLYEAVDSNGPRDGRSIAHQVAIYDDGVGSGALKTVRILGGAFGWGLKRNVKQLYTELIRVYKPGDQIYLFGFSRGAFTVRTLAGLIAECGIPDGNRCENEDDMKDVVGRAYRIYRLRHAAALRMLLVRLSRLDPKTYAEDQWNEFCAWEKSLKKSDPPEGSLYDLTDVEKKEIKVPAPWIPEEERITKRPATFAGREQKEDDMKPLSRSRKRRTEGMITFIGVWDTVDAVGVPFAPVARVLNRLIYRFTFPDTVLSKVVYRARQALAIDDERLTFHPLLWREQGEVANRIVQVWFPGAHSNVGGGYPKQGLSLVSLDWMMAHAHDYGLCFVPSIWDDYRNRRNEFDKLYDSRRGLAVYYRLKTRDIEALCREPRAINSLQTEQEKTLDKITKTISQEEDWLSITRIHASALSRVGAGTEGYSPGNLPAEFVVDRWGASLEQEDAAEIASELGEEISKQKRSSLLEVASKSAALRRNAYYVFFGASLLTAFFLLPDAASSPWTEFGSELKAYIAGDHAVLGTWIGRVPKSIWASVGSIGDITVLGVLFALPSVLIGKWWLTLILLASYLVSYNAFRKRRAELMHFWHPLRKKLSSRLS